ncbi:Tad domain-containing protein [Tabrizicola sp.]|uniref:TadE/TadG family type IV pilus assembly protein n=1 Tax=Tabrizicola sp. TaxID=2005166 RepID=UPI002736C6A6|nr:Tad domain-containing protein [Tabrizicola sp.]MDP3194980.1 Tad domain-containing protein [Tabrizicola sp.]
MLTKPAKRPVSPLVVRKFSDFRSEEEGGVTIFVVMLFVMMILFGGIAVDVMRYEWRRVTLQETMDRAMLAAANLVIPPNQTPQSVAQSWFDVAGLGDELTVDYSAPTITGEATSSSRRVVGTARVRSYNHFMHLMDYPYFEGPVASGAQQGVSKIEVILVLDITGSMGESSGTTTKIAALRTAATNFVNILKFSRDAGGNYTIPKDPNNLISIGMVPYSSNVNMPATLRDQFTYSNIANWWQQPPGVPNINCFEFPVSSWTQTAMSRTTAYPLAAVADTYRPGTIPNPTVQTSTTGGRVVLSFRSPTATGTGTTGSVPNMAGNDVICNHGDNPSTAANETTGNMVLLPTTVPSTVTSQIALLQPRGRTSIAVGMRWGTLLMDETARPIYDALRSGVPGMEGRPVANNDAETRKIIVLMTDGDHVASDHIRDAYKTGLSPIWRGADGNFAIRFTAGGPALTGGTRPYMPTATNTCSGWPIATNREYFIPHRKANAVAQRVGTQAEGAGTGQSITGACDPLAWQATPAWTGSGTVRQLDWSEVWRFVRVDWVVQQLYMRSGVSGTSSYTTVRNTFVAPYLTDDAYMDNLLNQNCTAAKTAGFEVFGIILGDAVVEAPVQNCASPGTGYYYKVTSGDALNAAFEQIAVLVSPLKLTQ